MVLTAARPAVGGRLCPGHSDLPCPFCRWELDQKNVGRSWSAHRGLPCWGQELTFWLWSSDITVYLHGVLPSSRCRLVPTRRSTGAWLCAGVCLSGVCEKQKKAAVHGSQLGRQDLAGHGLCSRVQLRSLQGARPFQEAAQASQLECLFVHCRFL